jgi:hypothetical protein
VFDVITKGIRVGLLEILDFQRDIRARTLRNRKEL